MQRKAVRFVGDVLGDDDRADEIEEESPEEYAERKQIRIATNPPPRKRVDTMPQRTKASLPTRTELQDRIEELEAENEELHEKLDSIAEVLDDESEEGDEDGEEAEEEGGEEDNG